MVEEIVKVIKDFGITEKSDIFNCLSIDEHELIWTKDNVIILEGIGYGYVDVLGLSDEQFNEVLSHFE